MEVFPLTTTRWDGIVRVIDAWSGGLSRSLAHPMFLYELGWGAQKSFGKAAAVAWILFLIILVIGMINFAITRRISSSDMAPTKRGGKR